MQSGELHIVRLLFSWASFVFLSDQFPERGFGDLLYLAHTKPGDGTTQTTYYVIDFIFDQKNELVGSVRRVGHVILADFVKESKSARKVSFSFIDFLFE